MEKNNRWREAFLRMFHILTTYVEVQANKPLGHLLMEALLIITAVACLQVLAEWVGRF